MMTRIRTHLQRFRRDDSGTVAVESIIVLPILFWSLMAMYAFFDAYRQASMNTKGAYTIGDMLSRETNYVTNSYLNTAHSLFDLITRSQSASKLRVTVVRWDDVNKIYKLDWSKTRGSVPALTNTQVKNMAARLPVMPHNDRLIVVETWARYKPPFNVGIQEQDLYNFVFTRPRFTPQLLWSDTL